MVFRKLSICMALLYCSALLGCAGNGEVGVGGYASDFIGTVVGNSEYKHKEVLSNVKPSNSGKKDFKDPKYGILFSFPSDWKVIHPKDFYKFDQYTDLRVLLENGNGVIVVRAHQTDAVLTKNNYFEGAVVDSVDGIDIIAGSEFYDTLFLESVKDILHKVGLQEFKKYSNYSKGKLTTLTEKVVATDYGLKADIMTMISLKSNKPLFVIGKHFAPFETDYGT